MLSIEDRSTAAKADSERRLELKSFLMGCRAKLHPVDLGLPSTKRRQVSGLRRGEVAELIGVTVDWYRSFESGRPVRVSPRLISRVISAFRLDAPEALTLYRLAIPEIYAAAGGRASLPGW